MCVDLFFVLNCVFQIFLPGTRKCRLETVLACRLETVLVVVRAVVVNPRCWTTLKGPAVAVAVTAAKTAAAAVTNAARTAKKVKSRKIENKKSRGK